MIVHYNVTFMDAQKKILETVSFEADDLADLCNWISAYINGDPHAVLLTMELTNALPAFDPSA